jgi:hypothetical protein
MAQIQDPRGHQVAFVNKQNRLETESVTIAESLKETELGFGYNINTGVIPLTSSTESGVLYFKNLEDHEIVVEALAVGIDSDGTNASMSRITVVRNPTSVSFSTDVDINANRNFSSTKELSDASVAYKGAEAATITGGDDVLLFFQGAGSRLFATINLVIGVGNSIAIKIDTQTTSGTTSVYAALIAYLHPDIT